MLSVKTDRLELVIDFRPMVRLLIVLIFIYG
jgi:hypothetical protein